MNKIVFFVFLFFSSNLMAGDTLSYKMVDSASYNYYINKNWTELISIGNRSIKQGIDYYYLRMRIGVAFYEQAKYYSALPHFLQAYTLNSSDTILKEYIFYCFRFIGQTDEARKFSKSFSMELLQKLKLKNSNLLHMVAAESGIKFTTYENQGNMLYSNLALKHRLFKIGSLYHAFTYLDQNKTYEYYFTNLNYADYRYKINLEIKTVQIQYFIAGNFPIRKGWSIAPTLHYVNLYTLSDTSKYYSYKNGSLTKYNSSVNVSFTNYFSGSLGIKKTIGCFDVTAFTSLSNFDNKKQLQNGLSGSFYPFGNNKLVLSVTGYIQTEDGYKTLKTASSQSLVYSFGPKIWISVSTFFNTAKNINEGNGLLLNNSYDLTYKRGSCLLNYSLYKHFEIFGTYQREYKKESTQSKLYKFNTAIVGMKYNF
jgi:hypothetical protein